MKTIPEDTTSRSVGFFALVFGLLILTISFTGCNTTRGFGRDVKKVGGKIEQTADRVQYN
jgi:predicted small secreted protein